jgi:hypothetical protein
MGQVFLSALRLPLPIIILRVLMLHTHLGWYKSQLEAAVPRVSLILLQKKTYPRTGRRVSITLTRSKIVLIQALSDRYKLS